MTRWIIAGLALLAGCASQPEAARDSTSLAPAALRAEREGYALTPDSVRLWYRVVGEGRQTLLVNAANYFGRTLDTLATPGRRVVYYDIRGRGKTDSVPPTKMGIAEFDAEDIDAVRTAVGADSVALLGWSGGALAPVLYAVRHPERVTRLILLTPVGPRWEPWWSGMRANAARKVDTAAMAQLAAREKRGDFASDERALCREQARLALRTNWVDSTQWSRAPDVCDSPNEWPSRYNDFVPRLLAKLGRFDYRAELPKLRAPLLVVHGELDNPPLGGSEEWVALAPSARLLVIRGVGHWPHYEKPDVTLGALRAFLDGTWPRESVTVPPRP